MGEIDHAVATWSPMQRSLHDVRASHRRETSGRYPERQRDEGQAHGSIGVTSSCLCKKVEGAGFPFQVKSLEDGIDDAIHTFYVHKTHHGSGAAADFDKAALDHGAPSSVDAAPADRPCESPPPSRHNHR